MELIQNNPYRIAGILSNATARELQRQKARILAHARIGRDTESVFDFEFLNKISRAEVSVVEKAFSNVEQNQDKVNFALFWFLNANPFDKTAIEYLKNRDAEKAVEIWEKVTHNKDVNSKNFSAFNNLGTYKLLSQTEEDIKEGIEAKIKLIESDFFENFVHSVADETFTIDNEKQIEKLVDELLTQLKNYYSSSETLQLFSNCNGSTQKYLSKKFTEEPIHNIESRIESTKNKRKENKSEAYKFGLDLVTNCKDDLALLQSLLGKIDLKYKTIADQLANEVMQCGIDYFNESIENDSNENYLEHAQKLTKIADRIAVGKLTKDRAKDSLSSLAEMKDRELSQAIDILQSIKDAYQNNERQLLLQVKEQQASMRHGQSINWTKVSELITNCIDWDKATDLINEVIPRENITKIKNSRNDSKIKEYKKLVQFVFEKVNYSHKSKIKYLQYWESVRATKTATRSTSTYQSTDSEFSFSDNAWWILGVAGVLVGLMMDLGGGCIFTGFLGIGIGSKFSD